MSTSISSFLHSGLPPRLAAPPVSATQTFHSRHLVAPLFVLAVATVLLMPLGGDRAWADLLYAAEGHAWALRTSFWTEHLIHRTGKWLSVLAWFGAVLAWALAWRRADLARWRRPLGCLVVATLFAALLVSWMKSWTDMDCPWDLVRYGGERTWHGLFAVRPAGAPLGRCFPAGHASAGYAWVALYFFLRAARARWRGVGLAVGLLTGAVYGFSQQLRGAHFLSHDVWTLAICWFTALAVYVIGFGPLAAPACATDEHAP